MTDWVCKRGACLLVPSGPDRKKHLFALPLDPAVLKGYGSCPMVLMAGVTTIYEGVPFDDACLLGAGDHPFLDHPSYVNYRLALLERTSAVENKVSTGIFTVKAECSEQLIRKILHGAIQSKRIPAEFKLIIKQQLDL